MQKNFAKYVADVEMQKLDRLITNLGDVYTVYHDWGMRFRHRFYKSKEPRLPMTMIVSQWWLRRQYDIAIQQHSFDEHALINISPQVAPTNKNTIFSDEELRALEQNLPSQYQPFEGLRFPLSANQFRPSDDKINQRRKLKRY